MLEEEVLIRLSKPDSNDQLIQEAISDENYCELIQHYAQKWLSEDRVLHHAYALHLIRALGLRSLAIENVHLLKEQWIHLENPLFNRALSRQSPSCDGVSFFVSPVAYYALPTFAETALKVLFELIPRRHPAYMLALKWGLEALKQEPTLCFLIWEAWPVEDSLLPLSDYYSLLCDQDPSIQEALAIRIALFHPSEALEICDVFKRNTALDIQPFTHALHKQLMRVKQVKLWVQCRERLKKADTKIIQGDV